MSESQSRSVYLRRRALAVAGAALGVVLLTWIIGGLVGDEAPLRTAAEGSSSTPPSTPPSSLPSDPASSSSMTSPSETPPVSPVSSAAPVPVTTTTPPPPPPDPNLPCPDAAVSVAAEVGAPSYRVGTRPVLRLVVANTGAVPCTRDIAVNLRELVVSAADGTRLWSSNDCYSPPGGAAHPQVFGAGERLVFTVNWAGRTSSPGCPSKRTAVPAGSYLVTPKLGALVGAPVALVLV